MNSAKAVILAAGEGKRMKSNRPKVLHEICGQSLLGHVLAAVDGLCGEIIVVVGHGADQVEAAFGKRVRYALQEKQLGTGHAVMQAEPLLPGEGLVFVLCGDTPLLTRADMEGLAAAQRESKAAAAILTARVPDPYGYGRIVRDEAGRVRAIVEEKDAGHAERMIDEINTGTYLFSADALREALANLDNKNAQGEYYLTDCIGFFIGRGREVTTFVLDDYRRALGVNDRVQLTQAETMMRDRTNRMLMEKGVSLQDPATAYVDVNVTVGRGTVILPNTMLRGNTTVGEECVIGPNCEITDSRIANSVIIRHSVVTGAVIEDGVSVGPFAHLRPETVLRAGVKIGDFVEIKKSDVGPHTKIPHLSYVGDADLGRGANLGAGTIVVNYDGKRKHKTIIKDKAFIGCNSNLVAPVTIGKGAFVAAGSTITQDVPDAALSLARPKQVNKEGLAARFIQTGKDGDS